MKNDDLDRLWTTIAIGGITKEFVFFVEPKINGSKKCIYRLE